MKTRKTRTSKTPLGGWFRKREACGIAAEIRAAEPAAKTARRQAVEAGFDFYGLNSLQDAAEYAAAGRCDKARSALDKARRDTAALGEKWARWDRGEPV